MRLATERLIAAAAAAGTVLKNLFPDAASDIQAALTSYLAGIPDSDAKSNGIKLGEAVATKCLEGSDGASVADAYRPVTTAGVYTSCINYKRQSRDTARAKLSPHPTTPRTTPDRPGAGLNTEFTTHEAA
jgi:hypothetical protein